MVARVQHPARLYFNLARGPSLLGLVVAAIALFFSAENGAKVCCRLAIERGIAFLGPGFGLGCRDTESQRLSQPHQPPQPAADSASARARFTLVSRNNVCAAHLTRSFARRTAPLMLTSPIRGLRQGCVQDYDRTHTLVGQRVLRKGDKKTGARGVISPRSPAAPAAAPPLFIFMLALWRRSAVLAADVHCQRKAASGCDGTAPPLDRCR